MALTYVAIATVTVGSGGAANIEFTSIPGTYTDLLVKTSLRSTDATTSAGQIANLKLNGSTSNFNQRALVSVGNVVDYNNDTVSRIYINPSDFTSSTFGNAEIYIPNYAGSNNKSISSDSVAENNATAARLGLIASLWSNSAAITSLTLTPNSGNFVQYSTATLYGIKNTV